MAQGAGYSFSSTTVSGSKVRDLAGYFLHGTIVGSAAISTGGGKYGDGLNCTGGAMQVANIDHYFYPVNTDGGISIGAWVKLNDNTAAARCVASATSNSALSWAVYASNASGNVEVKVAGATFSTSTSIRDGAQHHILMVVNATPSPDTLDVYVDGTNVLSTTLATSLTYPGNVTMEVGRNVLTGTEALNGVASDVRWWNDPVESTYVSTVVSTGQVDFQFAMYAFDDDTADDISIYNRDLTLASSATFSTAMYGRGITASGTEAAASGAVNFGDVDRLSVTGWIRLDAAPTGSSKSAMAITDSSGTNKMLLVVNTDRTLTSTWVTVHGTYSVTSGSALTVGQWSRFHLNMNPTYIGMRLDSSTQTQTPSSNPVPHLSPTVLDAKTVYIGGDATGGAQVSYDYVTFTKNFLDAVSDLYWAGPPTPAAIKPVNLSRGVYTFNENTGTTANDRSGNGNNLTLTSGGSWMTGVQGSALHSGGTSPNGVAARKASGLVWGSAPKGWSYAGWVKCRASSSGARFLTMRNSSGEVAHTGVLSGLFWVRLYGSGGTTGIINPSNATITAETWTHVAISCNGDRIQFYLNGQRVSSAAYTVGSLLSPTELNIGGDTADDAVADADDFALYDTPIGDANVLWLYQNPGMLTAGTPVENARSTTWRTKAQATATKVTTWDTRISVAASRATTWNVLAALIAVTANRSTTWDVLKGVTGSRSTTWNVSSAGSTQVLASRATTWRLLQIAAAVKATTWQVQSETGGSGFTVKFPTYRVPLGTVPPLNRQWMDMPIALVKFNGEWIETAVPYAELLEKAEKFYLGGYIYDLSPAEVADLPPQYVEPIS